MRQMFVNKVKETEAELKEKEREVSVELSCFYWMRDLLQSLTAQLAISSDSVFLLHSLVLLPPALPPFTHPPILSLLLFRSQLHDKFEQLKRMHQEEKRKVEEKRRDLEEEMNTFNRKKVAAETLPLSQPLKKDKDKKK